jgi:hypothetical protein
LDVPLGIMQRIAGQTSKQDKQSKTNNKTVALIGKIIGYDGVITMNNVIAQTVLAQQRKGVSVDVRATYVRGA